MKNILNILIIILFASCSNSRTSIPATTQTPQALQPQAKTSVINNISKRGYSNIIDELFNEISEKNESIKKIISTKNTLVENKYEATKAITEFNNKNIQYYSSALQETNNINDSSFKKNIQKILKDNEEVYTNNFKNYNALLKQIENQEINIEDYFSILKITSTLPIINKFQNNNKPSIEDATKHSQLQLQLLELLMQNAK